MNDIHQLPELILNILLPFRQAFSAPVWKKVLILAPGAILVQGTRTITAILRVMGLSQEKNFSRFHRFLSRDKFSMLTCARILLKTLDVLTPANEFLILIGDDTIERRWGAMIKKLGLYRDPVRSSQSMLVKCTGLKWGMLCVRFKFPWSSIMRALPFLTMLHTPPKKDKDDGKRHCTSIDWMRKGLLFVRRVLPHRKIIFIGDGGFACIQFLHDLMEHSITVVSRLRVDAALYEYPPEPEKGKRGRRRIKGARLKSFKEMAADPEQIWTKSKVNWYGGEVKEKEYITGVNLWYKPGSKPIPVRWVLIKPENPGDMLVPLFSTDVDMTPEMIIELFVTRHSIETTFQETRAHLGVETQRQYSDLAIERSTPFLMGLYSIIHLIGMKMYQLKLLTTESTAWYDKPETELTFSDLIASVRRYIWSGRLSGIFSVSAKKDESIKLMADNAQNLINIMSRST